jgi:hypothetical protein
MEGTKPRGSATAVPQSRNRITSGAIEQSIFRVFWLLLAAVARPYAELALAKSVQIFKRRVLLQRNAPSLSRPPRSSIGHGISVKQQFLHV